MGLLSLAKADNCPGCDELEDSGPVGACCLGSVSIGNDYTEARCNHVWAGPNTTSADCEELRACCYEYENGRCTRERCFDCYHNGGKILHTCNSCVNRGTTTQPTTRTKHTRPRTTQTLPTLTTPHPTGSNGCCCIPGRLPRQTTAEECHDCGGQYRGDGSSCQTENICLAQCCQADTRICAPCPNAYNSTYTFVGFGAECPAEACGVTCCLNAQPIEAGNSQICEDAGGTAYPETPLSQADCGGLCCIGLQYFIAASEAECTEASEGRYLGDGVGYEPGACGGACCVEGGDCQILTIEQCADLPNGVYQGDDVQCGDFQVRGPNEDSTSDSSSSSSSRSRSRTSSTSSETSEETPDTEESSLEDNEFLDVCANDGTCCLPDGGGPVRVASSRQCYKRGGVFLGEGVFPTGDDDDDDGDEACVGGVCCCEADGFAGKMVANKAECDLFEGHYAGDGSRLTMPGVCDSRAGACICGQQCLEVPSAQKCHELHGESFRGVGTRCNEGPLTPPDESDDEGACCIAQSFHNDRPRCTLQQSRKHCQFLGGVWSGSGSECRDDTCQEIRGACCTVGPNHEAVCRDGVTVQECRECHGHWSGAESQCSDEYTCQATHQGACCRDGHDCSMSTATACRRVGGHFQGFESTCQSNHGQICKRCAPCELEAPSCDEQTECENPDAVCVREYGKCMVLATPIPSVYNYTAPPEEESSDTDSSSSSQDAPPTEPPVRKRGGPHGHHHHQSDSESDHHGHGHGHHDHNGPDTATPDNYLGPLKCSDDDSTLGLPCLVSPFRGKCRIGTCRPPLNNSTTCKSVCRDIHEYPCGCECDGAWMRKCAAVSGRIINDTNHNGEFDSGDGGVVHAHVHLYKSDGAGGYDFVTEQYSGPSGGHFAFTSLEPGDYKVRVTLPGCQAFDPDVNHRFVTVSCLESAEAAQRIHSKYNAKAAPHSFVVEHRENGVHLATGVDFFTVYDCDEADEQRNDVDEDGDLGGAPTPPVEQPADDVEGEDQVDASSLSSSSDGLSTGAIVGIVIGSFFCCLLILYCFCCGFVFVSTAKDLDPKASSRLRAGKKMRR